VRWALFVLFNILGSLPHQNSWPGMTRYHWVPTDLDCFEKAEYLLLRSIFIYAFLKRIFRHSEVKSFANINLFISRKFREYERSNLFRTFSDFEIEILSKLPKSKSPINYFVINIIGNKTLNKVNADLKSTFPFNKKIIKNICVICNL
jgi:hypothetical protein